MRRILRSFLFAWLMMFFLYGLHTLQSVSGETERAEARLARMNAVVERQTEKNRQLWLMAEETDERSELERIGREQLFLFYPNEKIFITTGN